MKRSISNSEDSLDFDVMQMKKKIKGSEEGPVPEESVLSDENLLFEIMKHADARTLGAAACVSRKWHRTAQDERLWELVCTKHWTNIECGSDQLRSVVLALGGFRRLHYNYLLPLSKPSTSTVTSSSSSTVAAAAATSAWPCLPPPRTTLRSKPTATTAGKTRWGKDEVQLSLSLLSIRYYEKMKLNYRSK